MNTTTNGNYATYTEAGKWYYHPTDSEWLTYNHNRDFSRAYGTEAEALADAELKEEMDAARCDETIMGADGIARP